MSKRFVLLDRDGTIVVERNYLSQPDQVELIPRVAEGLKRLSELDLGLLVVTNQSGIARGYFDEVRLAQIHRRMCDLLAAHGVHLDGIYVCPHRPEDDCGCRKPRAGLVATAATELGFDPTDSFLVGDKPCDIELGRRVGAATFLVRTGYGSQHEGVEGAEADYVVDDVLGAACIIEQIVSETLDRVHVPIATDSRSLKVGKKSSRFFMVFVGLVAVENDYLLSPKWSNTFRDDLLA